MFRKVFAFLFLAVIMLISFVPVSAFAQDATVTAGAFFDVFYPYLVEIVSVIITVVVGWLASRFLKLTGIQIEAKHREALQEALKNGALFGLNAAGNKADKIHINLKSPVVATAVTYVLQSSPDAIKYFGLTPDRLRELVVAKLPPEYTYV